MVESSMFTPRPKQQEVLDYQGGTMGIAAVPGSGKTWTLSLLAAEMISRGILEEGQEILIVTLVNSAVDNFYQRVSSFIQTQGLLPTGYRVRTLHGLAHDIVRARPDLVYLSDAFEIIDERAAQDVLSRITHAWLRSHPYDLDEYLNPDLQEDENRREWLRRERLPGLVRDLAGNFIRYAKDRELTPEGLRIKLEEIPGQLPLAEMGYEIYRAYQQALDYRGAVDFDDLIRLALAALQADPDYLARLQDRWPVILEDEAQDSSRLQEAILLLLAGDHGNWVRVGDPNQAIYETFTTANPQFLREFIQQADFPKELPNSGRSTQGIIDLANYLIDWTANEHPVNAARTALSLPHILPTPAGDPQPNPEDSQTQVFILQEGYTPEAEIREVANSVARWLPEHPHETVAVLVPRNVRGFQLVDELRRRGIEPVDSLLRSTNTTRLAAGALANLLQYLEDPKSPRRLATVYKVWRREERAEEGAAAEINQAVRLMESCTDVEAFLWPRPDTDWLEALNLEAEDQPIESSLADFREQVRRWQGAILLPIDQLILTLAQDLFADPGELAVAHKLAVILGRAMDNNLDWRLPDFTQEIAVVARNERRFIGFSEDDLGFDPDRYPGQVVVSTMHKAKGLEWDRVYLMSVNNYDFPSGMPYDQFIAEKWFVRDQLNLEAETLAQLDALLSTDPFDWYDEGVASRQARLDYVSERLRLLYVGVTRTKKELIVTWNTGRNGELQPAIPLVALGTFWEERKRDSAI